MTEIALVYMGIVNCGFQAVSELNFILPQECRTTQSGLGCLELKTSIISYFLIICLHTDFQVVLVKFFWNVRLWMCVYWEWVR